jgi:dolichyl-phosphate-mannose--protein O-mannosyl transferase
MNIFGLTGLGLCLLSTAFTIWMLCAFLSLPNPIKIAALAILELLIIALMVFHMRFHKQEMEELTDE